MSDRRWVKYDAIEYGECPGEGYIELDGTPPITVHGPDENGVLWVQARSWEHRGAVSVDPGSPAYKAFLALAPARAALSSPPPHDGEGA